MHDAVTTYQFSLVKGSERFFVRCAAGREEETIAQLMEWAEDPDMDFDWFDAAVMARQITQRVFDRTSGQEQEADTKPEVN